MSTSHTTDRGQVGIGTLIVFIAMVLVAAIASGVLITAAGHLEAKAAESSEDTSEQVSNRVLVFNRIGTDIDSNNETVGVVNLTVGLSPSADEIDLSEATIHWLGPSGSYTLTHDSTADGDGNFSVAAVKDDDTSLPATLNARGDRGVISLDVDTFTGSDLQAGATVELRITTAEGATTFVTLDVPQSVAGAVTVRA